MSAAGKVITGFSEPWVASYSHSGTTVSYTNAQKLARGVEVSIEPETSDASNFYADNIVAETVGGQFTGGTATLTVDGLLPTAERLIQGLDTADTDGWLAYNKNQSAPYMGVGFIVRYLSGGTTSYTPVVLPKVVFNPQTLSAATQEDEVEFQTQELEATILRDDTTDMNWKFVGAECSSEADALALLQAKLGVTPTT